MKEDYESWSIIKTRDGEIEIYAKINVSVKSDMNVITKIKGILENRIKLDFIFFDPDTSIRDSIIDSMGMAILGINNYSFDDFVIVTYTIKYNFEEIDLIQYFADNIGKPTGLIVELSDGSSIDVTRDIKVDENYFP